MRLFFLLCVFMLTSSVAMSEEVNSGDCYRYLTQLVRRSNFPFKYVDKNKVNIIIDDDSDNVVEGQLVFDTAGSGEIGWIEYNVKERKLLNKSVELDKPEELRFNKKYAEQYERCKLRSNN